VKLSEVTGRRRPPRNALNIKVTQQLLNAAKREFDVHPLPNLPPDKAYSPASLAKAYMREMNIIEPLDKFEVSDEILGSRCRRTSGVRQKHTSGAHCTGHAP